jgi:hypothetical protein
MKTYQITFIKDGEETIQNWYGYDEQGAISQCFLSNAQDGARELKVIEIK